MQHHRTSSPWSLLSPRAVAGLALAAAGAADAAAQCPALPGPILSAEDPALQEELGYGVSLDGDLLAAGAPWSGGGGTYAGAVHVFHRQPDGAWLEAAKLTPAGLLNESGFGYRLALRGDVLAATTFTWPKGHPNGLHVFERTGPGPGDWTEVLAFQDPGWDPTQFNFFDSVALDGADTLFVGKRTFTGAVEEQGAVFVFERTAPGTWAEKGVLLDPEPLARGHFGASVAIEGDLAVVGANGARDIWVPVQAGSAHVFERDPSSPSGWTHVAELPASVETFGTDFGSGVAIGGGRIFVSAPGNFALAIPGRLEVFEAGAAGGWTSARVLEQSPQGDLLQLYGERLGWSDGYLAVGAAGFSPVDVTGPGGSGNSGAVYLYHEDAGGPGAFGLVELQVPVVEAGYRYGHGIALQGDLLAAGAPGNDAPCPGGTAGGLFGACNYGVVHLDLLESDLPLVASPPSISLAQGGAQTIEVREGSCFAGHVALVAGSARGTTPGFGLGPWTVPLNPDAYFLLSLAQAGSPPFSGTLAVLDASGAATSTIQVPAGLSPALAGVVLHHASALLDPASFAVLDVSDAVPLALVP